MKRKVIVAVLAGVTVLGFAAYGTAESPVDVDLQGTIAAAERQLQDGEFIEAEQLAQTAVERVESRSGRYDGQLVTPLTLLGQAKHGQNDFPAAIEAFERALHVSRISGGLHNPDQVDIVYKEADSWLALGNLERAGELQHYAFEVLTRSHGPNAPELVPAHYRMAEWHLRTYAIFEAREHYEAAVRILDASQEPETSRIPALSGLVESYKRERLPPIGVLDPGPTFSISTGPTLHRPAIDERRRTVNRFGKGEQALRQIIRIREADPDVTTEQLTEAYLDLADWHLIFERWNDAETLYRYARKLWLQRGGDEAVVNAHFERPHPIYLPLPNTPRAMTGMPPNLRRDGHVELTYAIDARGRTHNVRAAAADPPDVIDSRAVRAMRVAIFRPPLGADGLEAAADQKLRHHFQYVPESLRSVPARHEPEPQEQEAAATERTRS